MFDNYEDIRDEIDFLEREVMNLDELTPEEKEKYGDHYVNGKLRDDYESVMDELKPQEDILFNKTMLGEDKDMREGLSNLLQEETEKRAQHAGQLNHQAKMQQDALNVWALKNYGIPLSDIGDIVPKNEQESQLLDTINGLYAETLALKQLAVDKYLIAKTYYDRKFDKNLHLELETGLRAMRTQIHNGWKRGKAGEIIMAMAMGLEDPNDPELQKKIAGFLSSVRPAESKFLYRYYKAKGFKESLSAMVGDKKISLAKGQIVTLVMNAISLASNSLSQMAPYGMKIVPSTMASFAAVGAAAGTVGGPLAPATSTAGALIGLEWGAITGMTMAGFIMEYTNAVFDIMGEKGYDIMDPESMAKALQDEEVWREGNARGLKRGIPISIVNMFAMGMAGHVFKASALAPLSVRVATQVGERVTFDPFMEGLGELSAQIVAGQDIDWKEITLESWGGLGNNTSNMALSKSIEWYKHSNTDLANQLMDFNFMAKESASDERISEWANNMHELGQISKEQNQKIQKNIGRRRDAREILGVTKGRKSSALEGRIMELLDIKEQLGKSKSTKHAYSNLIKAIDAEIEFIATNKKLMSDDKAVDVGLILSGNPELETRIFRTTQYMIYGRKFSRKKFRAIIDKMTVEDLEKAFKEGEIHVRNDEEMNTLLKEKRGEVVEFLETREETPTAGRTIEVLKKPGETEVEYKARQEKAQKEYEESEVGKMEIKEAEEKQKSLQSIAEYIAGLKETDVITLNEANQKVYKENKEEVDILVSEIKEGVKVVEQPTVEGGIPSPIKGTRNHKKAYDDGTLDDKTLQGLLVEIANKFLEKKKLTPFQNELEKKYRYEVAKYQGDIQGAIDLEESLKQGPRVDFKMEEESDYRMWHKAPGPTKGESNRGDNMSDIYPEDVYGPEGARLYGRGSLDSYIADKRVIDILKGMRGDPNKEVTIYRAVPEGVTEINSGDWVSLDKDYAKEHSAWIKGKSKIISKVVKAKDLFTEGNSIHEWGYSPVKKPKKKKVAEPKTKPTKELDKIAQRYGMNIHGFIPKTANVYQLTKDLKPLGYTIKRAGVNELGQGGGIMIVDQKNRRYKPKTPPSPYLKTTKRVETVEGEQALIDEINALTGGIVTEVGLPGPQFIGAVTQGDVSNLNKLTAAMNLSFTGVNISSTQDMFNTVIETEGVKQYLRGGERIYGVTVDGDIWINPQVHNSESSLFNTAIHEMGHVWTNFLKTTKKGTDIYNKGVELVKKTREYQQQLRKFGGNEIRAAEETIAILIGNKGEDIANASLKSKFTEWLVGMWNYVKSKFKLSKDLTTDEIQDLTLDDFIGTALADIFSGQEIKMTDKQLIQLKNPEVAFRSTESMEDIIFKGRAQGISDASIKAVLKGRGFTTSDINTAMVIDLGKDINLPQEFRNIEGGVYEGLRLFTEVRKKLNKYNKKRQRTQADIRGQGMEILQTESIFLKQNRQTQLELLSAFDRSLGIRTNVQVQTEMSKIRQTLKERRRGAKQIKDLQGTLKQFIRSVLPVSDIYSQAQLNKVVSAVAGVTESNYIAKTEAILKIVEKQRAKIKKQTIKDILRIVNNKARTMRTRSRRTRGRGLDVEGQAFFATAKRILKLAVDNDVDGMLKVMNEITDEAVQAKIGMTIDELINKEIKEGTKSLTTEEKEILDKIVAVDTFGDILNMELEDVQEILKSVRDVRAESISRLKTKRLERAERIAKLDKKAESQLREDYPDLFVFDEKTQKWRPRDENEMAQEWKKIGKNFREGKIFKALQGIIKGLKYNTVSTLHNMVKNNLLHLGTLMNAIDRVNKGRSFFTDHIYRPLNRMNEAHLRGKHQQDSVLDRLANAIPGITKGFSEISKKLYGHHTFKLNGVEKVYNYDQMLRIYALSLNDVQRVKLEKQGFTEEKMQELKKVLGKELITFADSVVNYLSNEYYESVNTIYVQANDVNLPRVDNYFPTSTIQPKVDTEVLLDANSTNFSKIFDVESAPAFKERTDTTGDVNLEFNFTEVLENHLNTMEKYKAYVLGVKDLGGIVSAKSVVAFLNRTGIKKVVENAINFAINPQSMNPADGSGMSSWLSSYTAYALAFKAIQILKQSTSFINAFESYQGIKGKKGHIWNVVDAIMFMGDMSFVIATLPWQINKAMAMSATFRNRVQKGMEGDLYGLETGQPGTTGTGIVEYLHKLRTGKSLDKSQEAWARGYRVIKWWGASPTVSGDIIGIMGYMANYRANIRNGMSQEQALELFNEYEETQQTRSGTQKIPLQMSKHFMARVATMFGSTLFLQMNKVYSSLQNIMRSMGEGKIPISKDVRSFAINFAIANMLFVAASNIFKITKGDEDDKEEAWKRIKDAMKGFNLLYQIPLLGGAIEDAIRYMRTGRYQTSESIVNPFSNVGRKMFKDAKDLTTYQKSKKFIRPIVELNIGFQLEPAIGVIDMLDKGYSDDAMYDILGVSPSYRPKHRGGSDRIPKKSDYIPPDVKELKKQIRKLKKDLKK